MVKKVTYVKVLGYIFLVCAIFLLGTSIFIGPTLNTLGGLVILIFSLFYLANPAILYDDQEIRIKNVLGMTLRIYRFDRDKIAVEGDHIYVNGERLKCSRTILHQEEFVALLDHIIAKQDKPNGTAAIQKKTSAEKIADVVVDSDLMKKLLGLSHLF